MEVDSSTIDRTDVPLELCRRMRASSYYIGALLARFGRRSCPCRADATSGAGRLDQRIKEACARSARRWRRRADSSWRRRDGADRLGCVHGYGHRRRHDQRHAYGLRASGTTTIYAEATHRRSGELPQLDGLPRQGRGHDDMIRIRGVQRLQSRHPVCRHSRSDENGHADDRRRRDAAT